jgi:drug/metabolite transporter (DMT)-like permease
MVATVRPLVHAAYVFLGVTAAVLLYGVGTGTLSVPTTPTDWGLIAGITVVGTLFPMILFTAGLARIPASTASIVSTSEPLTTVVLGIALLGEPLTPVIAVGGVAILASVVLASPATERAVGDWLRRRRRTRTEGSDG